MAAICVECKKSVERSFGVTNTLIIHKMLAGLLGVWYMEMTCLGVVIFLVWYIIESTLPYDVIKRPNPNHFLSWMAKDIQYCNIAI